MSKKKIRKTKVPIDKDVKVRSHPLYIPPSKRNPNGRMTTRRSHSRHIHSSMTLEEVLGTKPRVDIKKLPHPAKKKLEHKRADEFDDLIAKWCDFFNEKFPSQSPNARLDPDVLKALISSESSFRPEVKHPNGAVGLGQITKETFKIIQDPNGEAKDFVFSGLRQKDLKNPDVAIALLSRWMMRKRETAHSKLGRAPTVEEWILEYKGLLKSSTSFKNSALSNFRKEYNALKK